MYGQEKNSDYEREILPIPAVPSMGVSDLVAKMQEKKAKEKIALRPKKINNKEGNSVSFDIYMTFIR